MAQVLPLDFSPEPPEASLEARIQGQFDLPTPCSSVLVLQHPCGQRMPKPRSRPRPQPQPQHAVASQVTRAGHRQMFGLNSISL